MWARLVVVAGVVAAGWGLAGCGGDGQRASTATPESARTQASASATVAPSLTIVPPRTATAAGGGTATPTSAATPGGTGDSGFIEGMVQAGPTCPVERVDSPCPDRPLEADVTILDEAGTIIARARSDTHGHFTVEVRPGTYLVRGESPTGGPFPFPPEAVEAVVATGSTTAVTLAYDTGIR